MELISQELIEGGSASFQVEAAFLVGMLSLVDTLYSRPMEEVILEMNLADVSAQALRSPAARLDRQQKIKTFRERIQRKIRPLNVLIF